MKNLRSSAKLFFPLLCIFYGFSMLSMENPASSLEIEKYIKDLIKVPFGPHVRAFMQVFPDDQDTQLLNRYIDVMFVHFCQQRDQGKRIDLKHSLEELTHSALCRANLQKVFNVATNEDLKYTLGTMGILYDSYAPCNTWNQCFLIIKERILRKKAYIDI